MTPKPSRKKDRESEREIYIYIFIFICIECWMGLQEGLLAAVTPEQSKERDFFDFAFAEPSPGPLRGVGDMSHSKGCEKVPTSP